MPSLSKSLFIAGALILIAGCRKAPGPPSPEYEEAYRIHEKLYVAQLDEAYGAPQMDRALELLKQVKSSSSDAPDARRLIAAIELGKQQFARQAEEDKKRKAALSQPAAAGPKIDSAAIVASALPRTDAGPATSAAAVPDLDGGVGAPDPYGPGASLGALSRELGGCLADSGNTFTERGTGRLGQIYQISDSRYCQGKAPGLQGQVMLFINDVLFRKMPYTELGIEKVNLGPGSAPKPSAASQAADAGAQDKLTYVPSGVPAPPGTQPINGAPGGSPAAPPPPSLEYTGPKPEQPQPTY